MGVEAHGREFLLREPVDDRLDIFQPCTVLTHGALVLIAARGRLSLNHGPSSIEELMRPICMQEGKVDGKTRLQELDE